MARDPGGSWRGAALPPGTKSAVAVSQRRVGGAGRCWDSRRSPPCAARTSPAAPWPRPWLCKRPGRMGSRELSQVGTAAWFLEWNFLVAACFEGTPSGGRRAAGFFRVVTDPRGRRTWLLRAGLCVCVLLRLLLPGASAHFQALRTSVSLPFRASTCPEWRLLGTLLPAPITPWTRRVLGIGRVLMLILQEEVPCQAWGRAGRPRSAFLKPLLGQIHPLDQSTLGPVPAVRPGTGSASLLGGRGML